MRSRDTVIKETSKFDDLLISDGKSTIGKTGSKTLIEMIRRYNKNGTRIFVLALGNSPDLTTLDHIAGTTGGSVFNAVESADFEEGINKWLSSIISPRVVDLVVNLKDLDPELVFPEPIPEILGQDSCYHYRTLPRSLRQRCVLICER